MSETAKRALVTIVVLIVVCIGIWFIYRQATQPYRELQKAAEDLIEGMANWREEMEEDD